MPEGPYLFGVGVTVLAHAGTPVSDTPLSWVRRAITGEIDAIVPYASLIGAHTVLSSYYGVANEDATRLMANFMDAARVHWHGRMDESLVRDGLELAGAHNVDAWDGYYAQVARSEGANTILTVDDDFERVDGVSTEVVLEPEEFAALNDYLDGQ